jgi:hypothetical protein
MSLYVYAIGWAEAAPPPVDGLFDQPVFAVRAGPLAAIVSDCPQAVIRAERRHVAASQRVLAAVNAQLDVLPMAFGAIAQSEADLGRFLDEHKERLGGQLERIAGAVEMALKLSLDAPDPIAFLVERAPELEAARRRAFGRGRAPSHDEKIRLGQLCDAVLRGYREALTAQVLAVIEPACKDAMVLPVREEREIANLAVLVPRAGVDDFQAAVETSAADFDEALVFSILGPWPAHNFVGSLLQ